MANEAKKAILHALIDGSIVELMVKTGVENVWLDATTPLSSKLAEMVAAINLRAKSTDVTAEIKGAIDKLIDGAPGTYDTLKEIADYISVHQGVVDTLNAAIGNKAEKSAVEALQATVNALGSLAKKSVVAETDLDSDLKKKVNDAVQGNHSHANKTVLDGITAGKVSSWDGKGRMLVSATQPADMTASDLWASIVE